MIGARTAAWAKSGYTAKDYVQDSALIAYDGIENNGFGVHSTNPLRIKDLSGNGNDSEDLYTGCEIGADYFFCPTGIASPNVSIPLDFTFECVYDVVTPVYGVGVIFSVQKLGSSAVPAIQHYYWNNGTAMRFVHGNSSWVYDTMSSPICKEYIAASSSRDRIKKYILPLLNDMVFDELSLEASYSEGVWVYNDPDWLSSHHIDTSYYHYYTGHFKDGSYDAWHGIGPFTVVYKYVGE